MSEKTFVVQFTINGSNYSVSIRNAQSDATNNLQITGHTNVSNWFKTFDSMYNVIMMPSIIR